MARGLLLPFQRAQVTDFASGVGDVALRARVLLVLSAQRGELPWRHDFGSRLGLLRHAPADAASAELAAYYVREALAAWLPSLSVVGVGAEVSEGAALVVRVRYRAGAGRAVSEVTARV